MSPPGPQAHPQSVVAYIARETMVSMVINAALTALFFALLFGFAAPVRVWGAGGYVFDFAPQAFMVAGMSTLVPGALAGRARRAGAVAPWRGPSRLPRGLWRRAALMAGGAVVLALAGAATVLALAGAQSLPMLPALLAKLAFALVLAGIVTPWALKAALAA